MSASFEWRKWVNLPKNRWVLVAIVAAFLSLLVSIDHQQQRQGADYLKNLRDESGQFVMDQADTMMGFLSPAPDLPLPERQRLSDLYLLAYSQLDNYYVDVENQVEQEGPGDYLAFLETLALIQGSGQALPPLIEGTLATAAAKMSHIQSHGLVNEASLVHPTGLRVVVEMLLAMTGIAGMVGLVLLFYDWFSYEYEHQQIRLLYTQPFKRSRLVGAKLLVVLAVVLSLIVIFSVVALLYGRLRSGYWGSFQDPVALYEVKGEIEIFTVGHLLGNVLVFLMASSCLTLMVVVIASYLTRNSFLTLLLSSAFLGIPVGVAQASESRWLQRTPWYAFNFHNEYVSLIQNNQLAGQRLFTGSLLVGMLVLFIVSGSLYLKRLSWEALRN